jgi:hypothetical protein
MLERLSLPATAAERLRRLPPGPARAWLVAAGVAAGSVGFAVVADSQVRPAGLAPAPVPQRETNVATELTSLGGFQRRGALLVGEVTTRDGVPLRLVLDARTQALVGFRVLERTTDGPACPAQAPAAPEAPLPPRH